MPLASDTIELSEMAPLFTSWLIHVARECVPSLRAFPCPPAGAWNCPNHNVPRTGAVSYQTNPHAFGGEGHPSPSALSSSAAMRFKLSPVATPLVR